MNENIEVKNVENDTIVHISYILRDKKGEIIDQTSSEDLFEYLHGHDNIVPGLEKALNGKSKGDKINTLLTPSEGYGEYNSDLIRKVPKSEFPSDMRNPDIGDMFQAEEDGKWYLWRVDQIEENDIILNGNHELAGQDLNFEVEILGIRKATNEEIEHGHAHSAGHHHH